MVQGPLEEMVSLEVEAEVDVDVCLLAFLGTTTAVSWPRLAKGTENGLSRKLEVLDAGWGVGGDASWGDAGVGASTVDV